MNIVFPDRCDLDEASTAKLHELGAQLYDDTPSDESVIIGRVRDAEIITASFINITRNVIDNAPHLKYIISSAVGYEWIDYEYAASKGIKVLNCPTQNAEAVAEHAVALMLATARRVVEANASLRRGGWETQEFVGIELARKKLGLVGYGRVGELIAKKVSGFDMQVSYVNSSSTEAELTQLLQESDFVCLCLPLTDATRGSIDRQKLGLLKKNAIFINVARGAIADETALVELLEQNAIRGAGLDVFQDEPLTGKVPDSIQKIASMPNVVATPHVAYNTEETTARLGQELLENIRSCIDGDPINVVNRTRD